MTHAAKQVRCAQKRLKDIQKLMASVLNQGDTEGFERLLRAEVELLQREQFWLLQLEQEKATP